MNVSSVVATVSINDVMVSEAAGTMTFTVTLDNAVTDGFDIDVVFADVSATGGAALGPGVDYVNTAQTLTFAGLAGETQMFTVMVNDDATVEGIRITSYNVCYTKLLRPKLPAPLVS